QVDFREYIWRLLDVTCLENMWSGGVPFRCSLNPPPPCEAIIFVCFTEPEAAPEPAQEELDLSTYKNTQHHHYTTMTFVDLEGVMSKYRLPQPSSGRLTPRH
uniref:Uncharacterized protein n=1 Tax=Callorhinchus milii TaxID=7868 RepID=A0A4W3K4Q1_CALMI